MAQLIALYSTRPQSGKTTIANHLGFKHSFVTVKFAGTLKAMVYTFLRSFKDDPDWAYRCVEGDLKEKTIPWLGGITPRQLMISLGTAWGREMVDPNVWVTSGFAQVRKHLNDGMNVVVDDMRFPNEYKTLQQLGAKFIKVNRTQADGNLPAGDPTTEGLLMGIDWDLEIWAESGDIEGITDAVDRLVTP